MVFVGMVKQLLVSFEDGFRKETGKNVPFVALNFGWDKKCP